jgi:glycosyltransferase involved in cell wall biosynthesis
MTGSPTVTVCIPTYNRSGLLRSALQSVLWQSRRDVEVIVSDNASTDDTEDVVRSLRDPRVVYDRNPENLGLFANLSRCLRLGSGRYRVVLPDDDLMLPGNLERKIAFLERHPTAAMVHSGFRFLDAAGDPTGPIMNWARLGEDTLEPGPSFVRRSIALGGLVCVSSVMLRSEHIAEERFDADDGPYADMALWLRVAGRGDVGFLPEPLSGLRVHQASASSAFQTVRVRRGRSHLTPAHADALRQAHGRYVARADLDPSTRDALAESLARADRRLRLSILASSRVPAPALRAAKRAVGWRPGARLHRLVALDQPLPAGSPATTDPSSEGAR